MHGPYSTLTLADPVMADSLVIEPGAARVPAQPAQRPGRRRQERKRLVFRLVHVMHGGDEGLGRCRNISEAGVQLELSMQVNVGERIRVAFSADHAIDGSVAWCREGHCGVEFDAEIDYDAMLRDSAAVTRKKGFPGLCGDGALLATLRCDGQTRPIHVTEVTQSALKLRHEGQVRSSLHLSIRFGAGRERKGVVRWSKGNLAEVALLEPFTIGELGSVSRLAAASARM